MKNLIQDLIDQGDIIVDTNKNLANTNRTIFKDHFFKHDKGKASTLGTQDNITNYTEVSYDYTIHAISSRDAVHVDPKEELDNDEKNYDNQVCMILEAPRYDKDDNICLMD